MYIVLRSYVLKSPFSLLSQLPAVIQFRFEFNNSFVPGIGQFQCLGVSPCTTNDLVKSFMQGADQRPEAPLVRYQVVLDIRVAVDNPHIAKYIEKHTGRAPSPPFIAQVIESAPHVFAEKA
ncbi:hypothetical protein BMS3Bbin11_00122 [bacterium BMS3Bbin11]|nr:hypothetical protein BMS3Bbin11_00122 [bacterium BMS3Bbin11]